MLYEHQNYRTFLKQVLVEKNEKTNYSLRSFSEKLNVSHSFLSEVLNHRKSLSMDLAFKIAVRLGLTDSETQYFCLLVQMEQEKEPDYQEKLQIRMRSLNPNQAAYDLSTDVFKLISDWYHIAILELPLLTGFQLTAEHAAEKLGITKWEAEVAMERLLRLGLLKKSRDGSLKKTHREILGNSPVSNEAFQKYHRQMLEKAGDALKSQTPSERLSATDVVAIDSRDLKKIDRLARDFTAKVMAIANQCKHKNSLYALTVHFFKINSNERNLP